MNILNAFIHILTLISKQCFGKWTSMLDLCAGTNDVHSCMYLFNVYVNSSLN